MHHAGMFLTAFIIFCGLSNVSGLTETLNCFHCGSETDSGWDLPCEKFNYQNLFEGPCSIDHFCFKTVSNTGHVVRGCAAKKTAVESVIHTPGCHVTPDSTPTNITTVCMCDKPLCNSSQVVGFSASVFLFYLLMYFIVNM